MSIVITDAELRSRLAKVTLAELWDAGGKPIGHFMSREFFYKLMMSMPEAQVSEEELDRRFNEPGGSTLQEIWARLESS